MSISTSTSRTTIDPATDPAGDPREVVARALATSITVVDGVRPDQYHLPTPCDAFDVEQLLGHLLFALDRVATVGRGDELGLADEVVTSDDWSTDVRACAVAVDEAWRDDARLTATVELPWATMTGSEALEVYANEIIVHTWDLARATGQHASWDHDLIAAAARAIERELPMADRDPIWQAFLADAPAGTEFAAPFANAVDVAEGVAPIDRLVAWNGRQPSWCA